MYDYYLYIYIRLLPIHLYTTTAYCIWSVLQSLSPISISVFSFQQDVVKET